MTIMKINVEGLDQNVTASQIESVSAKFTVSMPSGEPFYNVAWEAFPNNNNDSFSFDIDVKTIFFNITSYNAQIVPHRISVMMNPNAAIRDVYGMIMLAVRNYYMSMFVVGINDQEISYKAIEATGEVDV